MPKAKPPPDPFRGIHVGDFIKSPFGLRGFVVARAYMVSKTEIPILRIDKGSGCSDYILATDAVVEHRAEELAIL